MSQETLPRLLNELSSFNRKKQDGREKPHKPVLFLAVLSMIENGELVENKISFSHELKTRFNRIFSQYAVGDDWSQISLPYFHLRSSFFWKHQILPGRESQYAKLTTAGGGRKRIDDNIAYAYLDQDVWALLHQPDKRLLVKEHLVSLVKKSTLDMSQKKIGTAFHESFRMNRLGIGQMLRLYYNAEKERATKPDNTYFTGNTNLGLNQVKSCRSYMKASGLISPGEKVTVFGEYVVEHDPSLDQVPTLWLCHYYFSTSHNQGPEYWNKIVASEFKLQATFTRSYLIELVKRHLIALGEKELVAGTYSGAVSVFLGSYTEQESLGNLRLLSAEGDKYTVTQPEPIPAAAFACMLADYWQAHWPDQDQVELREVTGSELARVLLLSDAQVLAFLAALSAPSVKLVSRQTRVSPHMVTRLWADEAAVWAALAH